MDIERDHPTALYRQIADALREGIAGGQYAPSGRLPTEAALGKHFGVSRVTIRLALESLNADGLIERRRGKGTFVAGRRVRHALNTVRSFHESLRQQGVPARMRILGLGLVAVPPGLGSVFADRECCTLLRRLHLDGDDPVALGCSYLPAALAGVSLNAASGQPAYALLEAMAGQRIVHADLAIGAEAADAALAAVLGVPLRAPLLLLERRSVFEDGSCAEVSRFHVRPERYRFVLRSGS